MKSSLILYTSFPGKDGGRRVDCSAVDRIKKKAKLPKKFRMFHGLRHHYAVTLANSGEFTLDMIGELLTHKSYEMTRRYAKFLPGQSEKGRKPCSRVNSKPGSPNSKKEKSGGNMKRKIKPGEQTEELGKAKVGFLKRDKENFDQFIKDKDLSGLIDEYGEEAVEEIMVGLGSTPSGNRIFSRLR